MSVGYPPLPSFPLAIDSDRTLFLVYNTSESRTTVENAPWQEDIDIEPTPEGRPEVWADNGFANIAGELLYYDAVEKDANGKVCRLKRCARNLGGRQTRFNPSGTWVRGFVIAEHHNQLVAAIMATQVYLLGLDGDISILESEPPCVDDALCVDAQLETEVLDSASPNCSGTTISYSININGTFSSFVLDFGDGSSTNSGLSGTHTYSPGSTIDPVLTVTSESCTVVQTPVNRTSTRVPEPPPPITPTLYVPEVPPFPNIIIPTLEQPTPQIELPQIVFPCLNLAPSINIPSVISIIPNEISIVPPSFTPLTISFGPAPVISTNFTFGPAPVITPGEFTFGPAPVINSATFNFGPMSFTFGPAPTVPPVSFTFGPAPTVPPVSFTFGPAPTVPPVSFAFGPAPTVPPVSFTFGPAPTINPVQFTFGPAPKVNPASFTFGPAPKVNSASFTFGPAPKVNSASFTFGPAPVVSSASFTFGSAPKVNSASFTFGPAPVVSSASFTFGSAPKIETSFNWGSPPKATGSFSWGNPPSVNASVEWGTPPSVVLSVDWPNKPISASIEWGYPPSIKASMDWGPPPEISVNWGAVPTISCVVAVECPGSGSTGAMRKGLTLDDNFVDDFNTDDFEIEVGDLGIPSEIKVVVPKFPDIEVKHDIPDFIELKSDVPSKIVVYQADVMPKEIRVVADPLPQSIRVDASSLPKSIALDASAVPGFISVVAPDLPSVIRVDGSGLPGSIKVVGIPESIEVRMPSEIVARLEVPENLEVPLVYRGDPVPIRFDSSVISEAGEQMCFALVPCGKK